jgi:diguanylate cyclase (GGDEF)-like protein
MPARPPPSDFLQQIAWLTGLRDRDQLDSCLVHILSAQFPGVDVAIHRLMGEVGDQRWLTGVQKHASQDEPHVEQPWMDWRDLPVPEDRPDWLVCMARQEAITVPGARPCILLPLPGEQQAQGVVQLQGATSLAKALAQRIDALLQVWQHVQNLIDYSERDTLTGLLNRKCFDESFYKASALPKSAAGDEARERRDHSIEPQYWLSVIDIDHFKTVNDRFGHLIGDEVLLLLSRVMRSSFRFYDQLYRFGGEEFVVLVRCPTEADAMAAFERFRDAVRNFVFPQVQKLTVSIGVTDVRPGDTPSAAVERADNAVYYAKHHGRDQVQSYADLVRRGELVVGTQDSDVELF